MSLLWPLVLVCLLPNVYSFERAYEWRDYDFTIPEDAIPGGLTADGEDIFIGQYHRGDQISVVEIFPGKKFVETVGPAGDIVQKNTSIKILCGDEQPLEWVRATSGDIHVVLIGRDVVIGGNIEEAYLNIGRISYANEIRIGKITGASMDRALMSFIYKGERVFYSTVFEVLTFDLPRRPPRRGHGRRHRPHKH